MLLLWPTGCTPLVCNWKIRVSSCGVQSVAVNTYFPLLVRWSVLLLSCRHLLFAAGWIHRWFWPFSANSCRTHHTMLFQHCSTCIAFSTSVRCCSHSSLHVFSVSWTTVTMCWSNFHDISPSVSSLLKMARPGLSLESAAQKTLPTPSFVYTGFSSTNAPCSNLPFWLLGNLPKYMLCFTCFVTCLLTEESCPQLPTSYLCFPSTSLQSANTFTVAGVYLWNDLIPQETSAPFTRGLQETAKDIFSTSPFYDWSRFTHIHLLSSVDLAVI